MKLGLVSPDVLFTFGSLSESQLTILLSISEIAISDLYENPTYLSIKSCMVLQAFNAVLKMRFEPILFDTGAGGFSALVSPLLS